MHRFGGCGGCVLALDGAGLAALASLYEIVHWPERGICGDAAEADVALVEGSVSTPEERDRLDGVRARSARLVALGICATVGGPQALRALAVDGARWPADLYAQPQTLGPLGVPAAIASQVRVDHSLWGCPVDAASLLVALRQLAAGIAPETERRAVCAECKLAASACLWVRDGAPCLGPVTRAGCGGLCPRHGRTCYGCFGPAEDAAMPAFVGSLARLDLPREGMARRFHFLTSAAPAFRAAGLESGSREGPEIP